MVISPSRWRSGSGFVLRRTRLGVAMRAIVDDRALLQLSGGRPGRTAMLTAGRWGAGLAAFRCADRLGADPQRRLLTLPGRQRLRRGSRQPAPLAAGAFLGAVVLGRPGPTPPATSTRPTPWARSASRTCVPPSRGDAVRGDPRAARACLRATASADPLSRCGPVRRSRRSGVGSPWCSSPRRSTPCCRPRPSTLVSKGFRLPLISLSLVGPATPVRSPRQMTFTGIGRLHADLGATGSPVGVAIAVVL